jgi:hypothetical protein
MSRASVTFDRSIEDAVVLLQHFTPLGYISPEAFETKKVA